jgi:transcription initiation factor TFIIB
MSEPFSISFEDEILFCKECGGNLIPIDNKAEVICEICGLVIDERLLDYAGQPRAFTTEEKNKKYNYGTPMTASSPNICLSTYISKKEINRMQNQITKRALKYNTNIPWRIRSSLVAINDIRRLGCNLHIPDVIIQDAIILFHKCVKAIVKLKGNLKGRSIKALTAAILYYLVKKQEIPVLFLEILENSDAGEKAIKKCYKFMLEVLNLKSPKISLDKFIVRFCFELNLPIYIQQSVINLIKDFSNNNNISGKNPLGYIAGAIYLTARSTGCKRKQAEIAAIAKITEVTLRSRFNELQAYLFQNLLPINKSKKASLSI